MRAALALVALALGLAAPARAELPVIKAEVVRTFPHDRGAWTEGLFIDNGEMFESTGEPNRSSVRRVDLASGRVIEKVMVPAPYYGEGIAPWHDQIVSLSWRNGVGFRWSRHGLRPLGRFQYLTEGWGLSRLGEDFVMSDGSSTLGVIDPATFRLKRIISVTAEGVPVDRLNELEVVDGEILANIWLTDRIARIDAATGHVLGWIDVSALHKRAGVFGQDQIPNGIAWDAKRRRLYVTGKEWPLLFEIKWPVGR